MDVQIVHITTLNASEAGGICCPIKMLIITSLVGYVESPSITSPYKRVLFHQYSTILLCLTRIHHHVDHHP